MKALHVSDYTMTFEGQGVTFIYEFSLGQYYLPPGSFTIVKKGVVQEFMSKNVLARMDSEGTRRSLAQVQEAVAQMTEAVTEGGKEMEELLRAPLTQSSLKKGFGLCANVMAQYYYFDPHFWDSVFEHAATDAHAKEVVDLVQGYKNVAREGFNTFYFETGYLPRLLALLAQQTGVPSEELYQYDEPDLYAVFDGKRVSAEELKNRNEAYVMIKDDRARVTLITGKAALTLAESFYEGVHIEPTNVFKGRCAHGTGKLIRGRVCNITRDYNDVSKMRSEMSAMSQGDILVTQTTDPEMMPALRKSAAAVTDIGGMLSHTAIVARELNIPCIVDTGTASKILKTGDMVEVDADNGIVRKI